MGEQQQFPAGAEPETFQIRQFKGANLVDQRTAIEDAEFAWLEGAIPIGGGNIKIVPGPAAVLATLPVAGSSLWGFSLTRSGAQTPILIAISTDGSIREISQGGVLTVVAIAGTVTTACRLTQWQDNRVLFIDPTKGYFGWDGTTFTTIDANKKGVEISAYAGRVWIVTGARTIAYTAPDSYTDFTAGNGAGTFAVNDPAFVGDINSLRSAFELLFIFGDAAVNSVSNVQASGTAPNVVTTFTNVNIVSNVGTPFASSTVVYYRSLLFFAPYGIYALVGFTPQKLSGKVDNMLPQFTFGADQQAATVSVYNVLAYALLVSWQDPDLGSSRTIILLVVDGKIAWMDAGGVDWITTLYIDGVPTLWALEGALVRQLLADVTAPVPYKIRTKLWDMGHARQIKQGIRSGLDVQVLTRPVEPTLTMDSEIASMNVNLGGLGNPLVWVGTSPITWVGTSPISWVGGGLQLWEGFSPLSGRYLGYTLTGTDAAFILSGIYLQYQRGGEWD